MKYSEIARARREEIERNKAARDRGEDPRAIVPSGLKAVDSRGGVRRGIMTLVAANTGDGKDHWMVHLMTAAAQRGYTAEVISMEDPAELTMDRSLATLTGINSARIYGAELEPRDLTKIGLATDEIEEWGDNIEFHTGAMRPREALALLKSSTADLRIVNYLQAFPGDGATLERTIADFCWELNDLAGKTGCAAVAFSQTNVAKVEERGLRLMEQSMRRDPQAPPNIEGFRPFGVGDLSWCTAAGIRAKDFQVLFRPGKYLKRAGRNVQDDRLELTRPKNNFGAEGKVVIGIDLKTSRLFDIEK